MMKIFLFFLIITFSKASRIRTKCETQYKHVKDDIIELKQQNELLKEELRTLIEQQNRTKEVIQELWERSDLNFKELQNAGRTSAERTTGMLEELINLSMPDNCNGVHIKGSIRSIHTIKPPNLAPRKVKCHVKNLEVWTVVLSREDNLQYHINNNFLPENFNRSWEEYKHGFGDLKNDYWIGNEVLSSLTSEGNWEAMVILKNWKNETAHGHWKGFRVLPESDQYKLIIGEYNDWKSTAGDSLSYHNNSYFSTYDRENEGHIHDHCARTYGAGWWYHKCHTSLLTAASAGSTNCNRHKAIHWAKWNDGCSLQAAQLMIRPTWK